jgi:hypothetical protein
MTFNSASSSNLIHDNRVRAVQEFQATAFGWFSYYVITRTYIRTLEKLSGVQLVKRFPTYLKDLGPYRELYEFNIKFHILFLSSPLRFQTLAACLFYNFFRKILRNLLGIYQLFRRTYTLHACGLPTLTMRTDVICSPKFWQQPTRWYNPYSLSWELWNKTFLNVTS